MTPKEKALKLANRFVTRSVFDMDNSELIKERKMARKFALICVDEMIEYTSSLKDLSDNIYSLEYLHEVKAQINLI